MAGKRDLRACGGTARVTLFVRVFKGRSLSVCDTVVRGTETDRQADYYMETVVKRWIRQYIWTTDSTRTSLLQRPPAS